MVTLAYNLSHVRWAFCLLKIFLKKLAFALPCSDWRKMRLTWIDGFVDCYFTRAVADGTDFFVFGFVVLFDHRFFARSEKYCRYASLPSFRLRRLFAFRPPTLPLADRTGFFSFVNIIFFIALKRYLHYIGYA